MDAGSRRGSPAPRAAAGADVRRAGREMAEGRAGERGAAGTPQPAARGQPRVCGPRPAGTGLAGSWGGSSASAATGHVAGRQGLGKTTRWRRKRGAESAGSPEAAGSLKRQRSRARAEPVESFAGDILFLCRAFEATGRRSLGTPRVTAGCSREAAGLLLRVSFYFFGPCVRGTAETPACGRFLPGSD